MECLTDPIAWWVEPFTTNVFMRNALWAGLLAVAATSVVGTWVVLRGMSFLGDALAHGVLPGIAIAFAFRRHLRPSHSSPRHASRPVAVHCSVAACRDQATSAPAGSRRSAGRRLASMPMSCETIDYETNDRVGHIRFSRPEGANAVSPAFAADLRQVMLDVNYDDSVKAVAVTAEGKGFCGGGDPKLFAGWGDDLAPQAHRMLMDFHSAIQLMNRIPKPFVAGVRGAAGGAGLSLTSAFDLVISGESAKYTMAYTRAAMTPDGTSSYFLARHIGLRRMLDLTLTNRVLSAAEAEAWGLVNRVVPHGELADAAAEWAARLAVGPTRSFMLAKWLVNRSLDVDRAAMIQNEAIAVELNARTADAAEGVASFLERRPPRWRGH